MTSEVVIQVNDRIHLSEIRQSAFVEHVNDKDICDHALRIPYPYSEKHAEQFIGITAEATKKHGHPVHFGIRHAAAYRQPPQYHAGYSLYSLYGLNGCYTPGLVATDTADHLSMESNSVQFWNEP